MENRRFSRKHRALPLLLGMLATTVVLAFWSAGGWVSAESVTPAASRAAPAGEPELATARVREAVARALPYVEEHGVAWIEKFGCVSCHQVPSMLWSFNEAAAHGMAVDRTKLDEWNRWSIEKSLETGTSNADGIAQMVLGRLHYGTEGTGSYAALAEIVAEAQKPDGSWEAGGQLPLQRRPAEESHRVSTVWSVLALASAGGPQESLENGRERVDGWLGEDGTSHEWLLVRLLYEHRFGDAAKSRSLLSDVLGEQNEDGGWGWVRGEASDAFATGQTLYALERVGWPADDAAVVRARAFLLDTQQADGSWVVRSTLKREEGPVATSNYWGSAWAVIGLLRSLPGS